MSSFGLPGGRGRRPAAARSRWAVAIVMALMLLGACSSGADVLSPGERAGGAGDAVTASAATPLPSPTPALPVVADAEIRAQVGTEVPVAPVVDADPMLEPLAVDVLGDVPGLTPNGWQPEEAGRWAAQVRVTDRLGRQVDATIDFVARHPQNPDAVVAIGDSVASGHGLDISDYLGRDACFRSDDGYPHLVVETLVDNGSIAPGSDAFVVACSGADVADVSTVPVTGGRPAWSVDGSDTATQLDWAIGANPAIVLVTVGINDIGFVEPAGLVVGGRLDAATFDQRLAVMAAELGELIRTIVDTTDAAVVVTGYFNPAAARPQGVEGCRLECFRALTDDAVARLDRAIETALPDDGRVSFVRLAERFVDHGAPNGLGLDSARAGEGVLGDLFGDPFVGVQSYCASGDTIGDSWVNALDCVHPNADGHRAIAEAVVSVLG